MQYQINIPKPCHEDWEAMTPNDKGRHCGQCCKTVVDFTGWEVEEISAYLFAQKQQSVCGRFREEQLTDNYLTPETYIYQLQHSGLTFLKRVAALILFVFCLDTTANAQQKPRHIIGDTLIATPKNPQPLMGTPIRFEQGEPQIQVDKTKSAKQEKTAQKTVKQKDPKCVQPVKEDYPEIMGLIAMPLPPKDTAKTVKGRVKYIPPPKKK